MWSLLNYVPSPGHSRAALPALLARIAPQLSLFAPTFVDLRTDDGRVAKSNRPLLYHYIFVSGPADVIKRLCLAGIGFSFVLDRATTPPRHVEVSDQTLEQFRIIAAYHAGRIPCFPLSEISLEEGDRVRIVDGPCAGLTGTYISRRGGKSGNVLLSIDSSLAAIVYDVRADYVTVLEFARDSRRVYDQLDAFQHRLFDLLPESSTLPVDKNALQSLLPAALIFTRRLGEVKLPNPKLAGRLAILLYAAYTILSDAPKAAEALERYRALESHITNPRTLQTHNHLLRIMNNE